MGILEAAKPAVVICTRNRDRATAFYRDTLGLAIANEDNPANWAVLHAADRVARAGSPVAVPNHAERCNRRTRTAIGPKS